MLVNTVRQTHVTDEVDTYGTGDYTVTTFVNVAASPNAQQSRVDSSQSFVQSNEPAQLHHSSYEYDDQGTDHDESLDYVSPCYCEVSANECVEQDYCYADNQTNGERESEQGNQRFTSCHELSQNVAGKSEYGDDTSDNLYRYGFVSLFQVLDRGDGIQQLGKSSHSSSQNCQVDHAACAVAYCVENCEISECVCFGRSTHEHESAHCGSLQGQGCNERSHGSSAQHEVFRALGFFVPVKPHCDHTDKVATKYNYFNSHSLVASFPAFGTR